MTSKDKSQAASANSDYRAFLIRCWREGENWHFTLETIGRMRQQRHGFTSYEQLSAYMKKQFIKKDGDPVSDHNKGGAKK